MNVGDVCRGLKLTGVNFTLGSNMSGDHTAARGLVLGGGGAVIVLAGGDSRWKG